MRDIEIGWAFIPHGHCYPWQPALVWLHGMSDALTALAYSVISIALFCFVAQRRNSPFSRTFLWFGTFIAVCGTTHVLEVWTLWHPGYWLLGTFKAIAAAVSLYVALLLPSMIPKALALANPKRLEIVNQRLKQEIRERKRIEHELEAQQMFLHQVIDTVPSGIFIKDKAGYVIAVNQASATIHGTTIEAMLGKREPEFNTNFDFAQLEQFLAVNNAVIDTQQPHKECQLIITAQGEQRWYQTIINPFIGLDGQVQGIIGNSVDITDLKQTEAALQESEARFRMLIHDLNVGVLLHDANTEILLNNPAALQLLGLNEDQLQGKAAFDQGWNVIREDGAPFLGIDRPVALAVATGQAIHNVVMGVYRPQIGDRVWLLVNAEPQLDERGQVKQVICTLSNISERKRIEELLQQVAKVDSLTQIANRRWFDEHLSEEWRRLCREAAPLALILCDVDFFKRYNDHYGHQAGDACLQEIAQALQRVVKRPADLVARYGGEEFAVILPYTDTDRAVYVAQAIEQEIARLQLPHVRSQASNYVTLSMGIASGIPSPECSFEALIAMADQALYNAKERGRKTYCSKRL